jgi:hypothetical protein
MIITTVIGMAQAGTGAFISITKMTIGATIIITITTIIMITITTAITMEAATIIIRSLCMKILLLMLSISPLLAMTRAPQDAGRRCYYYDGKSTCCPRETWYGPGWYWGNYFDDSEAYFAWRQKHWGGPYFWRCKRAR